MSKQSVIVGLPIVPYNQNKHSDVCQYLEYLQEFCAEIFRPDEEQQQESSRVSETPLEKVKKREVILGGANVPLCGDLLGRERVSGAKRTRSGCDYATERFENIVENAAQWHAKQSFLGYIWEQLYRANAVSGREQGTLYNLRQQFRLMNVQTKVKKNYASAEHLMLSATKAYICEAFMTWAGFEKLDDTPTRLIIPPQETSDDEKKHFLETTVGKFVEEYVLTEFDVEKKQREEAEERRKEAGKQRSSNQLQNGQTVMMVKQAGQQLHVLGSGKIEDESFDESSTYVQLRILNISSIAASIASVGQLVRWPQASLAILRQPPDNNTAGSNVKSKASSYSAHDGVMNYALQVIQLGIILMQLNDTEKEGDGERCIRNWKLLMLYFRSRSRGTKYAFEAMRLITFTKALLTEQQAHRVIHGQFVNSKGGAGKNIANDLKMETMVKDHKKVLRGLCGNKTLKAIQRATSASRGLKSIVEKIDSESIVPSDSTHHTHASTEELVKEMIKVIKITKPFESRPGRKLISFPNILNSPLSKLDVKALHTWLSSNKKRLAEDKFAAHDGDDEEDSDDGESDDETDEDIMADEHLEEVTLAVETNCLS